MAQQGVVSGAMHAAARVGSARGTVEEGSLLVRARLTHSLSACRACARCLVVAVVARYQAQLDTLPNMMTVTRRTTAHSYMIVAQTTGAWAGRNVTYKVRAPHWRALALRRIARGAQRSACSITAAHAAPLSLPTRPLSIGLLATPAQRPDGPRAAPHRALRVTVVLARHTHTTPADDGGPRRPGAAVHAARRHAAAHPMVRQSARWCPLMISEVADAPTCLLSPRPPGERLLGLPLDPQEGRPDCGQGSRPRWCSEARNSTRPPVC